MKFIAVITLLVTTGCSILMPIAGGATGAALGSAVAGPPGAAAGGALGVAGAQMAFPTEDLETSVVIAATEAGLPVPGTTASTIHEAHELVTGLGWWYLWLFILIPLVTKKGRAWVRKFSDIHNSVSQKEIDAKSDAQNTRIKNLEEMLLKK